MFTRGFMRVTNAPKSPRFMILRRKKRNEPPNRSAEKFVLRVKNYLKIATLFWFARRIKRIRKSRPMRLQHDKHVFCEKPFSIGLPDAKKLLEIAENSKSVFQVGHNRRYAPVYAKLKELLNEDKAHSAHIKMNRGELLNPVWTGDVNVTGGFLYETTIHLFDMMRFQFGEIAELVAYGSQHEYPELDEFSIIFKFKNGFHCTFASSSDASWHFPFERIEVFCHHRTILTQEMEHLIDSKGY